ncbi:hypothetical protein BSLA_01r3543 [Burkholderia stabilis]|nr:hypothetical protein BSLA_01r3543 [Burkholderia stabilis]
MRRCTRSNYRLRRLPATPSAPARWSRSSAGSVLPVGRLHDGAAISEAGDLPNTDLAHVTELAPDAAETPDQQRMSVRMNARKASRSTRAMHRSPDDDWGGRGMRRVRDGAFVDVISGKILDRYGESRSKVEVGAMGIAHDQSLGEREIHDELGHLICPMSDWL